MKENIFEILKGWWTLYEKNRHLFIESNKCDC
jgi:hypothetical protein